MEVKLRRGMVASALSGVRPFDERASKHTIIFPFSRAVSRLGGKITASSIGVTPDPASDQCDLGAAGLGGELFPPTIGEGKGCPSTGLASATAGLQ